MNRFLDIAFVAYGVVVSAMVILYAAIGIVALRDWLLSRAGRRHG